MNIFVRLDALARLAAPFGLTLTLALIAVLPLPVPSYAHPGLGLVLFAIYYWAVFDPARLPAPAVFAIGLFVDFLTGGPMGLATVILLSVHTLVTNQRRLFVRKTFLMLWSGFALTASLAQIAWWMLDSGLTLAWVDPRPALIQLGAMIAAFPLMAWAMMSAQRSLFTEAA